MAGETTKVYFKQGGDELVIASGGAITVESGGGITGTTSTATASVAGIVKRGVAVANITPAADGTACGTALNALLASLRTAGIIAP